MDDDTRCVNYAYNHGLRHCSEKSLIWNGPIDRTGFEKDAAELVAAIRKAFIAMYSEIWSGGTPELRKISEYRRQILGHERPTPIKEIGRTQTLVCSDFNVPSRAWADVKSNMTCFACLQYAPDHVLPCGHGYCEDCVKDFSKSLPHGKYYYDLGKCVFCGSSAVDTLTEQSDGSSSTTPGPPSGNITQPLQATAQRQSQIIKLNPRCSGVRILALDGGGIRGIIELAILEKVADRTGLRLPIRDFFDLIVGTSTGSIFPSSDRLAADLAQAVSSP